MFSQSLDVMLQLGAIGPVTFDVFRVPLEIVELLRQQGSFLREASVFRCEVPVHEDESTIPVRRSATVCECFERDGVPSGNRGRLHT